MMVNLEKLYETLLFYAAHGWDGAICNTTGCRSDAEVEVFNLIEGPTGGRDPKPLMECNGFCGTMDLSPRNETADEINFDEDGQTSINFTNPT
jgi:hypothetical protein